MNMHSIHHRKRPEKVHQYTPSKRHHLRQITAPKLHKTPPHRQPSQTSHKPRDFFIRRHNADFMG